MDTLLPEIAAEITELRHQLHRHPELSGHESDTKVRIVAELKAAGFTPVEFSDHQGFTVSWPGEDRSHAIAFRADLDALPLHELSGKPWASERHGIMHACGHDGHASLLVGFAKLLARRNKPWPCDIVLVFQPSEESGLGAPQLIRDGLLQGPPHLDAIFGLHGWPDLPAGTVAIHPGPVMASVDNFDIHLSGVGAHGAMPHLGRDPIVAAAQLITAAQSLVSRETAPLSSAVITFGHIQAGSTYNIIPETVLLKGTVRSLDAGVRRQLKASLERVAAHIPAALGITSRLEWVEGTPPTINHAAMSEVVRRAASKTLGEKQVQSIPPSMGGEDFSYFLEKIPGAYFWLGLGNAQGGLHNPRFDFNDAIYPQALALLEAIVESYFSP